MDDLKNLKPGDKVLYHRDHHDKTPAVCTVDRVTPAGRIIVNLGSRTETFNPDGYKRGDTGWFRSRIVVATPERVAAAEEARERRDKVDILGRVVWSNLPIETLRAVYAIVEKELKP